MTARRIDLSNARVLISNDDGIHARGLACLAAALHADGNYDIRVVAPHTEQSACGHSITLSGNLEARTAADGRNLGLPTTFAVPAASVRGTPADCVKLATTSALLGGCPPSDSSLLRPGAPGRLLGLAPRRVQARQGVLWVIHRQQ